MVFEILRKKLAKVHLLTLSEFLISYIERYIHTHTLRGMKLTALPRHSM